LNAPSSAFLDQGRLKPPAALAEVLEQAGVEGDRPVITSCGSGVSAAIVSLALDELGRPAQALYDGSWTEWASRKGMPIETGPATRKRARG
jgi:thiosulfate/3-mercaptopyruvate sulfurtransferase